MNSKDISSEFFSHVTVKKGQIQYARSFLALILVAQGTSLAMHPQLPFVDNTFQ